MNSKLAFLIPLISLIYFVDTIRHKRLNKFLKVLLAILSFGILILDLLIAAVFYVNCWDANHLQSGNDCIKWIYPTLDFKILVVLSLILFTFSIYGLIKKWHRGIYFLFGSVVIYAGTACMIFILNDAKYVISLAVGINTIIILDIFSIVVIYGLITSLFYTGIFLLGLLTRYTLRPRRE